MSHGALPVVQHRIRTAVFAVKSKKEQVGLLESDRSVSRKGEGAIGNQPFKLTRHWVSGQDASDLFADRWIERLLLREKFKELPPPTQRSHSFVGHRHGLTSTGTKFVVDETSSPKTRFGLECLCIRVTMMRAVFSHDAVVMWPSCRLAAKCASVPKPMAIWCKLLNSCSF